MPLPRIPDKPPTWSAIRKQIAGWDAAKLLDLMKDLHDLAPANRDFLRARLASGGAAGSREILKSYLAKVTEPFYPARGGIGKLKFADARKAIRDYRKASDDVRGVLELMMTFAEKAVEFTMDYGDIGSSFYNSFDSMLADFETLMLKSGGEFYPEFQPRLEKIWKITKDKVGWGMPDTIRDVMKNLEDELGGQ